MCIRPPNGSLEWMTTFESIIAKAELEDKELLIFCDFNVDILSTHIPSKWILLQNIFNLLQ